MTRVVVRHPSSPIFPLEVRADGIPQELKCLASWGVWRNESVNTSKTRLSKVPYRLDGKRAATTIRDDWGAFNDAFTCYQAGNYDGIGFAFFPEDGLVGVDLDKVRDPTTGTIQSWALREIAALPTWGEISCSGTGCHLIGYGQLPNAAKSTKPGSQVEIYDGLPGRERYFAVTGHLLAGTPLHPQPITSEVIDAHRRVMAFDLKVAFERRGWLRGKRDTTQLVRCPWADAHTQGDDEAAIFKQRGRNAGYAFRCLHSHCQERTAIDVYELFGFSEGKIDDDRPSVMVGGDLSDKTTEVWEVLAGINAAAPSPVIYLFGSSFGCITYMTANEKPAIDVLTKEKLKGLLADSIRFQQLQGGMILPAHPPDAIVTNMLAARQAPPLPRLRRIVTAPIFAPDGSLLTEPGFHAAARVFYAPDFPAPTIAATPSSSDIREARQLIEQELLVDFPFVDQSDRAHAIALLLLFFARDMIGGDLPLHSIEKPEVGTGAGKLADVCVIPALGRRPPTLTDCNDEDEWRKRITALLRYAPEAVLLDNVVKIDSHHLAALFTTGTFQDRILGSSQIVDLPADMPWIATGNNPEYGFDIVRRVCAIRLDAKTVDPTQREGFKHELPLWAIETRSQLVAAALTLIQHWIVTGKHLGSRRVASFERWSRVMGGILDAAGIEGFGSNDSNFRKARNVRGNAWLALVRDWWERHGDAPVGTSDLMSSVTDLSLEGDLGLHLARTRDLSIAFGLALARQQGRQFRLEPTPPEEVAGHQFRMEQGGGVEGPPERVGWPILRSIEVRVEKPGQPTKKPYRLIQISGGR